MNRSFLLAFLLSLGFFARGQQPTLQNTLLWRISGKGLSKDSYLFGSMHLQDKRIFNLGDSLYYFLERSEGFALEVDMDEFMVEMFQEALNDREGDEIDSRLSPAEQRKLADSLLKAAGRNHPTFRKLLKGLRAQQLREAMEGEEMPTILDGYLYGIARRQGKWLGGVEDISGSLEMVDEFGTSFDEEAWMVPDDQFRAGLDNMIAIYLSADLQQIETYAAENADNIMRGKLMERRNLQMAKRMDSLSAIRSMFFTVGAGHLPGETGLINLLRKYGYDVRPVFSGRTIDPLVYAAGLKTIPWIVNTDEVRGYSVKMPGSASDMPFADSSVFMKIFLDITNMTAYMSMAVDADPNMDLSEALDVTISKSKGLVTNKKVFEKNGTRFAEAIYKSGGAFCRIQYRAGGGRFFAMIVTKQAEKDLNSKETDEFFNSLVIFQPKIETPSWVKFSSSEKAFEVEFPGKPNRNKEIEKTTEGTNWVYMALNSLDRSSGANYMVLVKETAPGYNMTSDTGYFRAYKEALGESIATISREEIDLYGSLNGYHLEGTLKEGGLFFKTYHIARGNRLYLINVVTNRGKEHDQGIDRFFSSFRLLDNTENSFTRQQSPDTSFSTIAPGPLVIDKVINDEGQTLENPGYRQYSSFNPGDAVSFNIQAHPFGKYYWAANDSTAVGDKLNIATDAGDSVLYQRNVSLGKTSGYELLIDEADVTNHTKILFVPDGDEYYLLQAWMLPDQVNTPGNLSFFSEFRTKNEKGSDWMRRNKTAELLAALGSGDSTEYETAYGAISNAPFTKTDLPLIHRSLLTPFYDDTLSNYSDARYELNKHLARLNDPSTVEFIRENYKAIPDNRWNAKQSMLWALIEHKTGRSYQLLKELLVNDPPLIKHESLFNYRIYDSLSLSRTLFPDLFPLLQNQYYAGAVLSLAEELIDSSLLTIDDLRSYRPDLLRIGRRLLDSIKTSEDYTTGYSFDLLTLLAKFNDPEGNELIRAFSGSGRFDYLSYEATLALLKNGQPADRAIIDSFASKLGFRSELFTDLEKIGKKDLFPARFRTQRAISESELYVIATEDYEAETIFLTEKIINYKGTRQKFFLYKIRYDFEDPETYLGISGPFSTDAKKITASGTVTGLYYNEPFDPKNPERQFNEYLKGLND